MAYDPLNAIFSGPRGIPPEPYDPPSDAERLETAITQMAHGLVMSHGVPPVKAWEWAEVFWEEAFRRAEALKGPIDRRWNTPLPVDQMTSRGPKTEG